MPFADRYLVSYTLFQSAKPFCKATDAQLPWSCSWSFKKSTVKGLITEPRKIVSSDLTAATDLLPLDLVRVVWEELLEALNTPEWAREVVYSCIGP